jgi:hypothetical protein
MMSSQGKERKVWDRAMKPPETKAEIWRSETAWPWTFFLTSPYRVMELQPVLLK